MSKEITALIGTFQEQIDTFIEEGWSIESIRDSLIKAINSKLKELNFDLIQEEK